MNFTRLSLAVMLLLNTTSASKLSQQSLMELREDSGAPAEVHDFSQFLLNTCSVNPKRPDRNLNVNLKKKSGYESEFFHMEGDAVRMSVPLNGATTGGSKNPRMELSETYHWPLPEGDNRMKATVTIQKTIPGVNFDLGQILRHNQKVVYKSGKKCPLHVQIEYQTNAQKIYLKSRGANCKYKKTKIHTKYRVGEEFSFELAVVDGIMTFTSSKGDNVEVGDFNFLLDEPGAEKGYFKAGIYNQKSCSKAYVSDPSKCTLGEGPDDLTVVDFKDISVTHE